MAFRDTDPNSKRMDAACFAFMKSIHTNAKRITNQHMFDKYVAMGYAFIYDSRAGTVRFKYLLDKFWIYPPGGHKGYIASLIDMGWLRE